jgi:hypothetical protein
MHKQQTTSASRTATCVMQKNSSVWISELSSHPIFKSPDHISDVLSLHSLNPSSANVSKNGGVIGTESVSEFSRRSNKLCFRGPDIIVAVRNEIRIATLALDSQNSSASAQYKVSIHEPVEVDQVRLIIRLSSETAHPQYPVRNPTNLLSPRWKDVSRCWHPPNCSHCFAAALLS